MIYLTCLIALRLIFAEVSTQTSLYVSDSPCSTLLDNFEGISTLKASSHIDDTTRHDNMRHDPFFRFPYNQMDQFTHMQHDNVWSSRQKAATTKIALEAIFVVCRSDSIKKTDKGNSFHK